MADLTEQGYGPLCELLPNAPPAGPVKGRGPKARALKALPVRKPQHDEAALPLHAQPALARDAGPLRPLVEQVQVES